MAAQKPLSSNTLHKSVHDAAPDAAKGSCCEAAKGSEAVGAGDFAAGSAKNSLRKRDRESGEGVSELCSGSDERAFEPVAGSDERASQPAAQPCKGASRRVSEARDRSAEPRVLVFGSLNIDRVYRVDAIVRPGQTITARGLKTFPGGKGLNQALACARAGLDSWMAGSTGADGELLLKTLGDSGVHTQLVSQSELGSGYALIQLDDEGNNCIIVYPAANRSLSTEQIDAGLAKFSKGDILVSQNEVNLVPYMVKRASELGLQVVYNPSPMDDEALQVDFSQLDFLFVNEGEACRLVRSIEPANSKNTAALESALPEQLLRKLCEHFVGLTVVLTLGEKGAFAGIQESKKTASGTDEHVSYLQVFAPAQKIEVKDTTAAGDTFTGYFLAGYFVHGSQRLGRKERLSRALQLASRAAGIAVTRVGAAASIPYRSELGEDLDLESADENSHEDLAYPAPAAE